MTYPRFTLVGNWTVTLSINFGGAQLILSAITLFREDFVATREFFFGTRFHHKRGLQSLCNTGTYH